MHASYYLLTLFTSSFTPQQPVNFSKLWLSFLFSAPSSCYVFHDMLWPIVARTVWGRRMWIEPCRRRPKRLCTVSETAMAFDTFWHIMWSMWNTPKIECWWDLPAVSKFLIYGHCNHEYKDPCGKPESNGQIFKNKHSFVNAANAFLQISKPFFSLIVKKTKFWEFMLPRCFKIQQLSLPINLIALNTCWLREAVLAKKKSRSREIHY